MAFSAADHHWMALALNEAQHGLYTTDPNPRVGCVLVRDGELLSKGFHARAGLPHAERNALNALPEGAAKGATCYVTLEPCSHTGRTGPCADALVASQVSRVVVAMQDTNPQVAGSGIARLRAAGIQVDVGLQQQAAAELNPGFISRFQRQRPWVRVKIAISLDGRTAMASGESQWITGAAAREDVQRLRARSSAIVTGYGTFIEDNPSLTVRPADWRLASYASRGDIEQVRQPLRVLLDSRGRATPNSKFFQAPGEAWVITANDTAAAQLSDLGLNTAMLGDVRQQIDLPALLDWLAERECNELLVEAGAQLAGAFIQADLVDELWVYQAPLLLGSKARPLARLELDTMAEAKSLEVVDQRQLGKDLRFILRPTNAQKDTEV